MKLYLLAACVVTCVVTLTSAQVRAGGLSKEKNATPRIQALIDDLKSKILENSGVDHVSAFTAISFRQQVVGGMNYFVKIRTGKNKYIHAKLYVRSWEHVKKVSAVKAGKSWEDRIEHIHQSVPIVS